MEKHRTLDIDQFLGEIYTCNKTFGLDLIMGVFFAMSLDHNYKLMGEVLNKVDINKLEGAHIIAFLTSTFKYSKQVPQHEDFYNKSEQRLRDLGKSEDKIKQLLGRLKDAGDYWKDMDEIEAPVWMAGQKPKE